MILIFLTPRYIYNSRRQFDASRTTMGRAESLSLILYSTMSRLASGFGSTEKTSHISEKLCFGGMTARKS